MVRLLTNRAGPPFDREKFKDSQKMPDTIKCFNDSRKNALDLAVKMERRDIMNVLLTVYEPVPSPSIQMQCV